jgi:hypothetical protein
MITGEIKNQIDRIWDAFWSGGISNPLEVIEQITYLLFLRRLDDLHTLEENKAARLQQPMERRIFPRGKDEIGKGGGRGEVGPDFDGDRHLCTHLSDEMHDHQCPRPRAAWTSRLTAVDRSRIEAERLLAGR